MKPNILNTILKILFVLCATACAWLVIGPLLGLAAGKGPHGHEWQSWIQSWIGSVAVSGVITLFVYIVWYSVNMLVRVEEQQPQIAQAVEALSRRVAELGDKTRTT